MSYGVSAALQAAVFQQLSGDAALGALIGPAVFDAVPAGAVPALYVTLGDESVRDLSDQTGGGARHDLRVSVIAQSAGFQQAKEAAAAVSDALLGAQITLARGRLVGLSFVRAVAKRGSNGTGRRIDMTFRARVEDD